MDSAKTRYQLKARLAVRRAEIAARLASLLTESGDSQRALAAALGKAPSSLSGWRSGRAQPSLEVLVELLYLTGRSAEWLLGLEDPDELGQPPVTALVAEPKATYEVDPLDAKRATLNSLVDELVEEAKARRKKR